MGTTNDDAAATPTQSVHSRRRWRLALGAGVALIALGVGVWWWSHPSLFNDGYGTFEANPLPVDQATQHWGLSGLAKNSLETIKLTGFRVHFSPNSAAATASLAVCVPRSRTSGTYFGADPKPPSDYCRELRPVRVGATTPMYLDGPRSDYSIVKISPTRAGIATAAGLDLTYRRSGSHLFQQGTQHIDDDDIFTVNAE